ncbi:hypothetical protein [Kitasatospora cineracea]|uniref:hypothetical protein n=1 Tax=Kitasatospora cineracea TaxID=88074 RepID=UPI0033C22FFC
MSDATLTAPRDYKANPEPLRLGTHLLCRNGEGKFLTVFKANLETPRWGLPGGSRGGMPGETPNETVTRHMFTRLGIVLPTPTLVLHCDWVGERQYPAGLNLFFDGGVLSDRKAAQVRLMPNSGYSDVQWFTGEELLSRRADDNGRARLEAALAALETGQGSLMTILGEGGKSLLAE